MTARIGKGQNAIAGKVLRSGLSLHEKNERDDQIMFEALKAAVLAGEESGVAEGDVMNEVRERIRNRASM